MRDLPPRRENLFTLAIIVDDLDLGSRKRIKRKRIIKRGIKIKVERRRDENI